MTTGGPLKLAGAWIPKFEHALNICNFSVLIVAQLFVSTFLRIINIQLCYFYDLMALS